MWFVWAFVCFMIIKESKIGIAKPQIIRVTIPEVNKAVYSEPALHSI
jgi:hypothetical protein